MEQVLGIGGVFFRARDPKKLAAWYQETLGVPVETGNTYGALFSRNGGEPSVWSAFCQRFGLLWAGRSAADGQLSSYNLDAMLAQLRAAEVPVLDKIEDSEFGRFRWATDPEGNRFELWQPPAVGAAAS
jgi:predicted enzyme related to lactoylglutathione lyase